METRGGLKSEFGFDLEVARSNLFSELIELGVVSRDIISEWKRDTRALAGTPIDIEAGRQRLIEAGVTDPAMLELTCEQWRSENRRRETLSDEDVEWEIAQRAAERHALLHGVPVLINGEMAPQCTKWPCMASGASYALWEICTVHAEQSFDAKRAVDGLARLAQAVRRLKADAAEVEDLVALQAARHATLASHIKLKPSPWDDPLAAVRMIEPLAELIAAGHERAREAFTSKDTRNARPGTPGRRKLWLLTAVSQHLGDGGYSQPRIASLVPDDAGGSEEGRVERVRHRLADTDCRSFTPSPPDE